MNERRVHHKQPRKERAGVGVGGLQALQSETNFISHFNGEVIMQDNVRYVRIGYQSDKLKFDTKAQEDEFYRAIGYAIMWGSTGATDDTCEYGQIVVNADKTIDVGHWSKHHISREAPAYCDKTEEAFNQANHLLYLTASKGGARPFVMHALVHSGDVKYSFHS